jgi:NIMA (never in mitosis gene a)-related kinase
MDNYKLKNRIGRGCFGDVQLARKRDNGKLYAIKRVHLDEEDKVNAVTLNHEVQVLASLHHPNIIRYFESFIHEDHICIVMYYADNGDLQKRVREARDQGFKFSEQMIWSWLIQLSYALKYIHR